LSECNNNNELFHSLPHIRQEASGFTLMLETDDDIIGKAHNEGSFDDAVVVSEIDGIERASTQNRRDAYHRRSLVGFDSHVVEPALGAFREVSMAAKNILEDEFKRSSKQLKAFLYSPH
jgi:hypothetical protein